MRDVNRGSAHTVVQGAQLFGHVLSKLGIKRTQGFVHHEGFWLAHDGAAKGDALPVATRKPAYGLIEKFLNAEHPGDFSHLGLDLCLGHTLTFQRVADILPHIEVRIKSKHLKNKSYIAFAGALLAHIFAIDINLPRSRQLQPGDHA